MTCFEAVSTLLLLQCWVEFLLNKAQQQHDKALVGVLGSTLILF